MHGVQRVTWLSAGVGPRGWWLGLAAGAALTLIGQSMLTATLSADAPARAAMKKWRDGTGWGWVWGKDDEVGSLNEMTDASRLAALRLATRGQVFDLGVRYSRRSYRWPGHSPGEIMSFRSPVGVKSQGDVGAFLADDINPAKIAWHSNAMFINDNIATQIDGLAHIVAGEDNHWYNGFREADWGGDFGVRKCDADSIPPIIARGVMVDIASLKGVPALPSNYEISIDDIKAALDRQGTELRPGDVVLLRTGTLSLWDEDGANHEKIAAHDSAGPSLTAVRYLVEKKGAMMIGSDTSGLEVGKPEAGATSPIPVHDYLLVQQGVHIGEFHNLEGLAKEKVYEFCYVGVTNRIAGATAGFCLRPLALR